MTPSRKSYITRGPARSVLEHIKRGEAVARLIDRELDDAGDVAAIWGLLYAKALRVFVQRLGIRT